MYRLTTDNPTDNIEASLNLFYVRDGDAFIRGGGDAPDYADISVTDFIRKAARTICPDMLLPESAEEISFAMAEYLFDGYEEPSGLIALLYTAAWSYAELRERLKAYEDTGLEPEAVETVNLALCAKHMVDLETLNNTPISRIVELAEADKDGRVVVLPCKVGDTVWRIIRDGEPHITRDEVRDMYFADDMTLCVELVGGRVTFTEKFGKTVFLSRAEAERDLQEMEGKKDG